MIHKRYILAAACLLLWTPVTLLAASSTTIGKSDALRCYEESQMGGSSSGIPYCDRAIKEGDLTLRDLAATYSNRGIIYAAEGNYEKAMADHNKALSLSSSLPQAYINRGNVYFRTNRFDKALADYENAIALAPPALGIAWYNKGLCLKKLHRKSEARDAFRKALELMPGTQKIQDQLDALGES